MGFLAATPIMKSVPLVSRVAELVQVALEQFAIRGSPEMKVTR